MSGLKIAIIDTDIDISTAMLVLVKCTKPPLGTKVYSWLLKNVGQLAVYLINGFYRPI
jgi:hypothetical protein